MRISGLMLVVVAVVAGCGDNPYGSNGACTPTATRVCTVGGNAFSPVTLTVPESTTVMWLNGDAVGHTVTSDVGSGETFNLSLGPASGAASHTFNTAGTYAYHCNIHAGMHGTINVN